MFGLLLILTVASAVVLIQAITWMGRDGAQFRVAGTVLAPLAVIAIVATSMGAWVPGFFR